MLLLLLHSSPARCNHTSSRVRGVDLAESRSACSRSRSEKMEVRHINGKEGFG